MPLIQSKSKSALSKNIETEMDAHPGQPKRNIAIAYAVKRKPKRKMAEGGAINESAASERRPMPDERDKDSAMIGRNSSRKSNGPDGWTENPTVKQAQNPSPKKLSRPPLKGSDAFSVRYRDEIEDGLDRMNSMPPSSPDDQPSSRDNEEGPNRQGPKISDMADEHSTRRKPYAKGGEVESSDYDASPNKYEDDLRDLPPSEDEGAMNARSRDEIGQNRQGPQVPDMEDEHVTGRKPYAEGGSIQYRDAMDSDDDMDLNPAHGKYSSDDSSDIPNEEADMEHEDSIAAAIMAKKARQLNLYSDSDIDHMAMMAEGGDPQSIYDKIKAAFSPDPKPSPTPKPVNMQQSPEKAKALANGMEGKYYKGGQIEGSDEDQVDLNLNSMEQPNKYYPRNENEVLKENYDDDMKDMSQPRNSNLMGDSEESDSENKHDMISQIRSKMNRQRQFKQR